MVVDMYATGTEMGPQCLQLMGMHVLSGCNTVFCVFDKGKLNALNTPQTDHFPGLYQVLDEGDVSRSNLMERGTSELCMVTHLEPR